MIEILLCITTWRSSFLTWGGSPDDRQILSAKVACHEMQTFRATSVWRSSVYVHYTIDRKSCIYTTGIPGASHAPAEEIT